MMFNKLDQPCSNNSCAYPNSSSVPYRRTDDSPPRRPTTSMTREHQHERMQNSHRDNLKDYHRDVSRDSHRGTIRDSHRDSLRETQAEANSNAFIPQQYESLAEKTRLQGHKSSKVINPKFLNKKKAESGPNKDTECKDSNNSSLHSSYTSTSIPKPVHLRFSSDEEVEDKNSIIAKQQSTSKRSLEGQDTTASLKRPHEDSKIDSKVPAPVESDDSSSTSKKQMTDSVKELSKKNQKEKGKSDISPKPPKKSKKIKASTAKIEMPDTKIVRKDVSSRETIDKIRRIMKDLKSERDILDEKIVKLYAQYKVCLASRKRDIYSTYSNYTDAAQQQHEVAVHVLQDYLSTSEVSSDGKNALPVVNDQLLALVQPITANEIIQSMCEREHSEESWAYDDHHDPDSLVEQILSVVNVNESNDASSECSDRQTSFSLPNIKRSESKNVCIIKIEDTADSSSMDGCNSTSTMSNTAHPSGGGDMNRCESTPLKKAPPSDDGQQVPGSSASVDDNVNIEKLNIIREALNHPEASNYTCESLHEILTKLASSKGYSNMFENSNMVPDPLSIAPAQSPKPAAVCKANVLDTSISKTQSQAPMSIQFERPINNHLTTNLKVEECTTSSDDDEDEESDSQPMADKQGAQQLTSEVGGGDASSDRMKCGDFHAFSQVPTAVVDMAVVWQTSERCEADAIKLIAGSQDGTINEINMQTKVIMRTYIKQSSSVTKLFLDAEQKLLFAAFYDSSFVVFNTKDGMLQHRRSLNGRVESACLGSTKKNEETIYLGLSSGELLRVMLNDYKMSVLWKHRAKKSKGIPASSILSISYCDDDNEERIVCGGQDGAICVISCSSGNLIYKVKVSNSSGPCNGISRIDTSPHLLFSYTPKSLRFHNWLAGRTESSHTMNCVTSACMMQNYVVSGDNDGTIQVFKFENDEMSTRPFKMLFAPSKCPITCLRSMKNTVIAGSMDGTVTVVLIRDTENLYVCLFGRNSCGMKFANRSDLISHVVNAHIDFTDKTYVYCCWGSRFCKYKFNVNQSVVSMKGHISSHVPVWN